VVSRRVEGDIHRTTNGEIAARARRMAKALRGLGVGLGDRVATLAWNGYRHLELYFGVSGSGRVLHTINPRLHPEQIAWIANHAEDQVLCFDMTFLPLVKAVHAEINQTKPSGSRPLKLIEIHREDIETLPDLMSLLRPDPHRFIVFCDDLSFDADDTSYKSLKAVLEGGIEGRPDNVIFYATSNRRHLLPRDMMDNERSTAINPGEAVEEKVSLSDRFGLWLGFHKCSQDEYLDMVFAYIDYLGLKTDRDAVRAEALEWATTRGARSGRTAWQFIQDLAGRLGKAI
jgi:acyl-CoA synthetase (AMP-forming)/AMP-acid ligase II